MDDWDDWGGSSPYTNSPRDPRLPRQLRSLKRAWQRWYARQISFRRARRRALAAALRRQDSETRRLQRAEERRRRADARRLKTTRSWHSEALFEAPTDDLETKAPPPHASGSLSGLSGGKSLTRMGKKQEGQKKNDDS